MTEKSILIKNYQISYFDENSENSNVLLFIHGNSLDKSTFENQLNNKEFKDYRLVALDLIGHGHSDKSTKPEKEYNVPYFAELIYSFIKNLNLTNISLVGHSLGGHIAIEILNKYPKLIAKMVIVGCPPLGIPADVSLAFCPNPSLRLIFQKELNTEEVEELAIAFGLKENEEYFINTITKTTPSFRSCIGESIIKHNFADEIKAIESTSIPFAIFVGSEDQVCNKKYFDKYDFKNQWRKKLQIIKGATHNPFVDNSLEFNSILIDFLNE